MASFFNSLIGRPPVAAAAAPSAQPNSNQANVDRITANLQTINFWINEVTEKANAIQQTSQAAVNETANQSGQNSSAQQDNCYTYLNTINDQVNALLNSINENPINNSNFNNLPAITDRNNSSRVMTRGGYYYPSTSSSRRNRRKRRNKKSRR